MCRALSYLGSPILIEDLLYKPDSSFIKQSYHPVYMPHLLNLAGFGMVAWDTGSSNPTLPYVYKTDRLPFYDDNLRNLTQKISPHCLLTHIRGVSYTGKGLVAKQNVHPFMFEGSNIAFAHNGALFEFEKMKYDLLEYISPNNKKIEGTTDSEWLYALFLSQLKNQNNPSVNEVSEAITETLKILKSLRYKHNIRVNSPMNLFISNGEFIACTRFVFDFGWEPIYPKPADSAHFVYHSLWYTYGEYYTVENNEYKMKQGDKMSSIIIASEPLTEDTTSWIEVPVYTLIVARLEDGLIKIVSQDISL